MTIAAADFTAAFPEFSNQTDYPPSQIAFWIPEAYAQLNATRFGAQIDLAAMLFVAHNLVLSKQNQATAGNGAPPGQTAGPLASKTVGPVSASYDTKTTAIDGAGAWNSTSYGQRLYAMMRMFNKGPFYAPHRIARHFRFPIFR